MKTIGGSLFTCAEAQATQRAAQHEATAILHRAALKISITAEGGLGCRACHKGDATVCNRSVMPLDVLGKEDWDFSSSASIEDNHVINQ